MYEKDNEIPLPTHQDDYNKKESYNNNDRPSVCGNMKNSNSTTLAGGDVIWYTDALEKFCSSSNTKHRVTLWSSISIPRYVPEK